MAKKINLEKEVSNLPDVEVEARITDEFLLEICPKEMLSKFKKAKTDAQRVDFLYQMVNEELKEARSIFKKLDDFATKLEQWFIQEMDEGQTGVSGKLGRVEVKQKTRASVIDWDAFYAYIAKKKEFDLLNRAVNNKAVSERWEAGKEIPGVGRYTGPVVSLTKVSK